MKLDTSGLRVNVMEVDRGKLIVKWNDLGMELILKWLNLWQLILKWKCDES
jgi:hypothetical protein